MLELELTAFWSPRNTSFRSTSPKNPVQYTVSTPWGYKRGSKTTKVTRWNGPKREIIATIRWAERVSNVLALPEITFVRHRSTSGVRSADTNTLEADTGTTDGSGTNSPQFLRRGEDNKLSYHLMTLPNGMQYEWKSKRAPKLYPKLPNVTSNDHTEANTNASDASEHHNGPAPKEESSLQPLAALQSGNILTRRKPVLLIDDDSPLSPGSESAPQAESSTAIQILDEIIVSFVVVEYFRSSSKFVST